MNGMSPNYNKESPKTPGGISKSLLTPCRRVGLSRKWRKGSCSPFISPLGAQNATPERTEVTEEKKRKKCDENELKEVNNVKSKELDRSYGCTTSSPMSCNNSNTNNDITTTPFRDTQTPRIKSKIRSLSLKNIENDKELASDKKLQNKSYVIDDSEKGTSNVDDAKSVNTKSIKGSKNMQIIEKTEPIIPALEQCVSKPARTESKNKKLSLKKSISKNQSELKDPIPKDSYDDPKPKEQSPNNLTKECIVVIQNKILKSEPQTKPSALQDSDSEPDVPLSMITRKCVENVTLNTLNDDDFISKPVKKKIRKLSTIKRNTTSVSMDTSSASQSSQEDTEKRTIIVKKTYDKVEMPHKAKSTGSISQKDIEDLKARIEMKKKLLLAKSMSIDTEELRGLIKKWQKGCQDALMELLDLMKKKLPDRQNMDYAEILETLKIPSELVGYDPENDCFITPNDTNVLLSTFKL